MSSPPRPVLKYRENATINANKSTFDRSAKTPFQNFNLQQRTFQSTSHRPTFRPKPTDQPLTAAKKYTLKLESVLGRPATTKKDNLLSTKKDNLLSTNKDSAYFSRKDVLLSTKKDILLATNRDLLFSTKKTEPINRSNQQVTRSLSEPSIKYQAVVNNKVYKILRKLGTGGTAKVYEGFEPQSAQTVAVKIINIAKADQKTQEGYFNEIELLKKLSNCKHVVKLYDSEYKSAVKELLIVMEKGDADLSQIINSYFQCKEKMIDGIFIKYYWRGMLQAVAEIHKHGIVHADLKPVNFILVKNHVKLIDFGIASLIDPGGTSIIRDHQIGTINYMAPETLKNRAAERSYYYDPSGGDENHKMKTVIKYNSKVDIWSLGCILYNLVYGKPPFEKYEDIPSKALAITNPNHKIHYPELSNQNLLNCIKSCLQYHPQDRPSAQDLLNDSYLNDDVLVIKR